MQDILNADIFVRVAISKVSIVPCYNFVKFYEVSDNPDI